MCTERGTGRIGAVFGFMQSSLLPVLLWALLFAWVWSVSIVSDAALAQQGSSVRPPANAVQSSAPPTRRPGIKSPRGGVVPEAVDPTASRGRVFDTDMWRNVRQGAAGSVSIPDKKAGLLVQSDGEMWRIIRNGPLVRYGAWAMGATLLLLALFFLVRGRVPIDKGWSGRTLTRFDNLERASHWLLAGSFIILALTGLNILYGRTVVMPLVGKELFASLSMYGKWLHNYVGFAFMVGLLLTLLIWLRHNLPDRYDFGWLIRGGGMFSKASHPPARKFNAGQKILFWLVILGGISISLSGIAMLFPFQAPLFAKTFAFLNMFGFELPTVLTPLQEMQYATTWHGIVALFLICVIFAHIYIGTIGMVGAFAAMGTGEVDENWAKQHHSVWAAEALNAEHPEPDATPAPAE